MSKRIRMTDHTSLFAEQQEIEIRVNDRESRLELKELPKMGFQVLYYKSDPNLYRINIPYKWTMEKIYTIHEKLTIIRNPEQLPIVEIIEGIEYDESYTDVFVNDLEIAKKIRAEELKEIEKEKVIKYRNSILKNRQDYWNDNIKYALYLERYTGEKSGNMPVIKRSCQGLFENEENMFKVIDYIEKNCNITIMDHLYFEEIDYDKYVKDIVRGAFKMRNIILSSFIGKE